MPLPEDSPDVNSPTCGVAIAKPDSDTEDCWPLFARGAGQAPAPRVTLLLGLVLTDRLPTPLHPLHLTNTVPHDRTWMMQRVRAPDCCRPHNPPSADQAPMEIGPPQGQCTGGERQPSAAWMDGESTAAGSARSLMQLMGMVTQKRSSNEQRTWRNGRQQAPLPPLRMHGLVQAQRPLTQGSLGQGLTCSDSKKESNAESRAVCPRRSPVLLLDRAVVEGFRHF